MPKGERMREQPYPAATQMRTLFEDYQSFGSSAKRRKLYHIADCGSMILCGAAPFRQAVASGGIRKAAAEITLPRKKSWLRSQLQNFFLLSLLGG